MKFHYSEVKKQGQWLVDNFPAYSRDYPKHAYEHITPVFNSVFGLTFSENQVRSRLKHYRERLRSGGYKESKMSRLYTKEQLDTFYNWLVQQRMVSKQKWEEKWLEITGCELSYASISQRLFQYGYRWNRITYSPSKQKHAVGDIVIRRNSKKSGISENSYVRWIKIKSFEDLSDSEKQIHMSHIRNLESSPCWMRYDRYVLEQSGVHISDTDYIVHLNGDTLDDNIDNLYVTKNYWNYNVLKVKGLCIVPSLVEASLELKKLEDKIMRIERK